MKYFKKIFFLICCVLPLFLAGCKPVVTITAPANGDTFTVGETITFDGQATDPLHPNLADAAFVWTSAKDGEIGTGPSFASSNLSEGEHTITLTVTDPVGQSGQSSVSITVGNGTTSTTTTPTTTTTIENASTTTTTGNTGTAGSLDTTFGTGGKVMTHIGVGDTNTAHAVAIQSDGKIVVAGDSSDGFALARYNTDGSIDTTFGSGGTVVTSDPSGLTGYAMAIQSNGKILVGGKSGVIFPTQFALARYNTDGSIDTTFGSGGIVKTSINSLEEIRAIGIQSTGKIVVAGDSSVSGQVDIFVMRYTSTGVLDTTFGPAIKDGTIRIWLTSTGLSNTGDDHARALKIQTDDKIVVAGRTQTSDFAVVRLTADGELDTTFGPNLDGGVMTPIGTGTDYAYALAIQTDGKIVVAGTSVTSNTFDNFAVVRYTSSGILDSTFGTGGNVTTEIVNASAWGVGIQSDGKIVAVGRTSGTYYDFAIVRYTASGSLDTTFGTGGIVITDVGGFGDHAYGIAFQTDGKFVVAGDALHNAPKTDFAIVRYNP